MYPETLEYAVQCDEHDELRGWRQRFSIPGATDGKPRVYFCGHSLGLMPQTVNQLVDEELEKWATLAVDGHFAAQMPWVSYHRLANEPYCELLGAKSDEVVAMNSLTVNLHLFMSSFFRPQGKRRKIIIESTAFPSDRYAAVSQIRMHGGNPEEDLLEWAPRQDSLSLQIGDLKTLLERYEREVALVLLPGVQYFSGEVLDLKSVAELAHEHEAIIGADLAHAVGNVPLQLHDWNIDFAVWCSYKYLNGGPGAIGGGFVHRNCQNQDPQTHLLGWWGNAEDSRFKMDRQFRPAVGADAWQLSNPAILALAPVIASLAYFQEAGLGALRKKSQHLTGWLRQLLENRFSQQIKIVTPAETDRQGCQLSLTVLDPAIDGKALHAQLTSLGVVSDWREPDVFRIAPAPFYNSFEDVWLFTEALDVALNKIRPS